MRRAINQAGCLLAMPLAVTLDERDNGLLWLHGAGGAIALLAADMGFVGLDDGLGAAKGAAVGLLRGCGAP